MIVPQGSMLETIHNVLLVLLVHTQPGEWRNALPVVLVKYSQILASRRALLAMQANTRARLPQHVLLVMLVLTVALARRHALLVVLVKYSQILARHRALLAMQANTRARLP